MRILGIETSCDETSVAILRDDRVIEAHEIYSQTTQHAPYGGVVPEIAARAHHEVLFDMLSLAQKNAGLTSFREVDAIAVTAGPGLIGGVIVGVMAAKSIASVTQKPLIGVNHLEGHALSVRLEQDLAFPYLLLLVSGGHCVLLLVKGVSDYVHLGGTLDDALGEAYDKVAKMLGLPYPGGPHVEKTAKDGDPNRFHFPRALCKKPGSDFSFSGIKTAVRQQIIDLKEEVGTLAEQDIADICASFEACVCDVVANRLSHACTRVKKMAPALTHVVVAGGVAANRNIRSTIMSVCAQHDLAFAAPSPLLCTDNGAMIAWAGVERFALGLTDSLLLTPKARWPLW